MVSPDTRDVDTPVTSTGEHLTATMLRSRRLRLEPLRIDDAEEMALVLGDAQLHRFTGGQPATVDELRRRYAALSTGRSGDARSRWLNWVVRRRDSVAVGYVQATVADGPGGTDAEVAWVIGTRHQRRGFACEAAQLMVGWLRQRGVSTVTAHIHPDHVASAAVARHIGLAPTEAVEDGEQRWQHAEPPVRA